MAANYDRNDRWNRRDGERYNPNDRGALERGADEVRSWFGDNDAERRRNIDERRDDLRDRSSYDSNRGALERGSDEVRSWFGDNDAERRRNIDERRDDLRDRNRYESGRYGSYGSSSYNERGPLERGADEVRSWFGDNDAERRRNIDERRDDTRQRYDYDHGSDYRHNYGNQRYDSDRVRTDLSRNSGNWGSEDRRSGTGNTYGTGNSYNTGHGYGTGSSYGQQTREGWEMSRPGDHRDDSGHNRSSYGSYGTPSGQSYGSSANYGYNNSGYRNQSSHDRSGDHDRGFLDRAGDEVRSWFGDDEAERRRQMDVRRDAGYRTDNYDDDRRNRGW